MIPEANTGNNFVADDDGDDFYYDCDSARDLSDGDGDCNDGDDGCGDSYDDGNDFSHDDDSMVTAMMVHWQ